MPNVFRNVVKDRLLLLRSQLTVKWLNFDGGTLRLAFKVKFESLGQVLNLFLTSQEYENSTLRQVSVDLHNLLERGFLVVRFSFFGVDGSHWELACLHVDAVGLAGDRFREESLVLAEVLHSERGRHDDQPKWVVLEFQ